MSLSPESRLGIQGACRRGYETFLARSLQKANTPVLDGRGVSSRVSNYEKGRSSVEHAAVGVKKDRRTKSLAL
jgi:hypothetical protein